MMIKKRIIIFQIVFFIVLLAVDLLSKHFIMRFLSEQTFGYYVLINKVLALRYSLNEGAGFGIFAGRQVFLIVFTSIAIVAIICLLVFFNINKQIQKRGGWLLTTSIVMIIAGGIGNLVDRIAFGHVRDFIEYTVVETLFNRRFAICNMADVFLTVGVVLLIVYVIFFYQEKKEKPITHVTDSCTDKTTHDNIGEALKLYESKYGDKDNSDIQQNSDDSQVDITDINNDLDAKNTRDNQDKEDN